jgi:hypothetical protein
VYAKQERLTVAERAIKKGIRMYRIAGNPKEARYAALLSWRGLLEKRLGRMDEARASQAEALAILQPIRKPGHYYLETVKHRLAILSQDAFSPGEWRVELSDDSN